MKHSPLRTRIQAALEKAVMFEIGRMEFGVETDRKIALVVEYTEALQDQIKEEVSQLPKPTAVSIEVDPGTSVRDYRKVPKNSITTIAGHGLVPESMIDHTMPEMPEFLKR